MAKSTLNQDIIFSNYQPIKSYIFGVSLLVEFVGTLLFTFMGNTVTNPTMVPFVNGLMLAVWIYTAANVSGGHLNPAVSISVFSCGFYPLVHTICYVVVQIAGGILGILLTVVLVPGLSLNMGYSGPGCIEMNANPALSQVQLFGWEFLMTFTLISCVYACGVAKPGHGSFTPLVVGLSLLASAGVGGPYTGAYLNPARVLGPAAIFKCGGVNIAVYIGAQLFAAFGACVIFSFVSGPGPLFPFISKKKLNISFDEAVLLWITGLLPKRLRESPSVTINDNV